MPLNCSLNQVLPQEHMRLPSPHLFGHCPTVHPPRPKSAASQHTQEAMSSRRPPHQKDSSDRIVPLPLAQCPEVLPPLGASFMGTWGFPTHPWGKQAHSVHSCSRQCLHLYMRPLLRKLHSLSIPTKVSTTYFFSCVQSSLLLLSGSHYGEIPSKS